MTSQTQPTSQCTTPSNDEENTDIGKYEYNVHNHDRPSPVTPRKRKASTERPCSGEQDNFISSKRNRAQSSSNQNVETDIDKVWAQMKAERPNLIQAGVSRSLSTDLHSEMVQFLGTPTAHPKPLSLQSLPKLAELEAKAAQSERNSDSEKNDPKSSLSGLKQILSHVRANNNVNSFAPTRSGKMSMLDGSRKSWHQFKKDNVITDELDGYKKDKRRYTDRAAFLARTELREWQFEQSNRKSRR